MKKTNSLGLYVLIVALGAVAVATQLKNRKDIALPSQTQKIPIFTSVEESFPYYCTGSHTNCVATLDTGEKLKASLVKDTQKGTLWVMLGNQMIPSQEFYRKVRKGHGPDSVVKLDFKESSQ